MTTPATLLVTLTGTNNPHLAAQLPTDGEITILEVAASGGLILSATFRPLADDGTLGAPVLCNHPVFTYGHAYSSGLWQRVQHAPTTAGPIAAQVAAVRARNAAGRSRVDLMAQNRGAHQGAPQG